MRSTNTDLVTVAWHRLACVVVVRDDIEYQ